MGSNEDRDYDEYKVKVKRYDKDGNDISGNKLGGGGRHRDDGTISAMAYDFEPLDSADDFSGMSRDELEYILALRLPRGNGRVTPRPFRHRTG